MFAKLFSEGGLSLDRLRALVEVGAAGSIAKAAGSDPIRQSQYSRQIKELEAFFQAKLVERHGKGIRLTASGRELARISRFFLLGLSNFRRGCQAEEQCFRIGACATFIDRVLLPVLGPPSATPQPRYALELADNHEIEQRLHELTLDFGVVTSNAISRPLQLRALARWRLDLWIPKSVCRDAGEARRALAERRLPFVLPAREFALADLALFRGCEPRLACGSLLEARAALEQGGTAAFLPLFLAPEGAGDRFVHLPAIAGAAPVLECHLAWNPRLLRLNPHAARRRDQLAALLEARIKCLGAPCEWGKEERTTGREAGPRSAGAEGSITRVRA